MNWKMAFCAGASALVCVMGAAHAQDTFKMGLEATYPPFESKSGDGKLQGFDVDIGNMICERMKVKCVYVENSFDGLIPALQARKFDAINSAMNITAKRKQAIDFTSPVYIVPIQMVAKRGSSLMPTTASLKGKTVGVLQGSSQEDYLKKHWATAGVKVTSYQDQDQVYADLVAGRIDAAVQESQTAMDGFLSKPAGKDFDYAGAPLSDPETLGEGTGLGMRKGDPQRARVQAAIDSLKKDGSFSKLSMKYFKRDIIAK
ncbi:lysine/arginine/ornithine transport system substrate-binding protein [Silvimonas terrae]|uniref:Lysine/arginine/ornithine transport system substrate-binding protein n=1 Tax=Silvimonas terrae TaxID=300266 RepID=A0A840RAF3_9NEIS|nr:ABC transporter substrate-binding protein [Silvimonas terrae]MBB5189332.1 lysine/arginine/ornithine transport system substrate-binding protein [Silvimonas terrae]